jgi:hypothetical protein
MTSFPRASSDPPKNKARPKAEILGASEASSLDKRLEPSLRRTREFCKPYRGGLAVTLVTELEDRTARITLAEPLFDRPQTLVCALHALAVAKHRTTRWRCQGRRNR